MRKKHKKFFDIFASQNVNYKKFCEGVKKLNREIDEECAEGERQIRFLNGTYIPDDIIKGGVL